MQGLNTKLYPQSFLYFYFEVGNHQVAELPRLDLNLASSCLSLCSAEVTGMWYHTHLVSFHFLNSNFCSLKVIFNVVHYIGIFIVSTFCIPFKKIFPYLLEITWFYI